MISINGQIKCRSRMTLYDAQSPKEQVKSACAKHPNPRGVMPVIISLTQVSCRSSMMNSGGECKRVLSQMGAEYCLGGRPVTTRPSNVWPCDNISGLGPETWSYWSRGLITRRFRTSQGPCTCGLVQVISGLGPDDIDQIGHKAL